MRRKTYFALSVALLVLVASSVSAQSQSKEYKLRVVDWAGGYFDSFYLIEDAPSDFDDFQSISVEYLPNQKDDEKLLIPDKHGNIPTAGKLVTKNGTIYRFKKSELIEGGRLIKLSFVTERVDGVSYRFEGEFLRDSKEIRKGELIIGYVRLEGVLMKFMYGSKVAEATLGLTTHGEA